MKLLSHLSSQKTTLILYAHKDKIDHIDLNTIYQLLMLMDEEEIFLAINFIFGLKRTFVITHKIKFLHIILFSFACPVH